MSKLKFTRKSVQDLTEIWDYTLKKWSEKQAEHYYQLIIEACNQIGKNPELGKEYEIIYPGLKGHKISKHIIFYRVLKNESIEIIRILHEVMDLKNKFDK